jgi:hypothetical protein
VGAAAPAHAPATAPPRATGLRTDPVSVVRADHRVDGEIRAALASCARHDTFPVDAHYGHLTGGSTPDLVVNVSTCADGVGVGVYVYRMRDGRWTDVFADERPPVAAQVSGSTLKVTHQVYGTQDPVSDPSGEDVTTYRWTGTVFTRVSTVHREYDGKGGGGASPSPTATGTPGAAGDGKGTSADG